MDYLLAIGGLVLLFLGGESLVRGAVGMARRFDVSPLFTGLVIVGFGTSAPELVVCIEAAWRGHYDITVGNIVGSNIANIMLILGLVALIQPVLSRSAILRRDGSVMLLASLLLMGLAYNGEVSRGVALIMLIGLIAFIIYCFRDERTDDETAKGRIAEAESFGRRTSRIWVALLVVAFGIGALAVGAVLLIDGATAIAVRAGISEAVIGVTLVAVGTSLPELATALVAAFRHHADVALGNVLGSNVFNVLGILGLTAVVQPFPISAGFLQLDLWVMLGVSVLLLLFLRTGYRLSRGESAVLLGGYGMYVGALLALPGWGA